MEPMNQFISSHRQEFKEYVDQICTVSDDQTTSRMPPSYATPVTIFSRLPPTAKEGFPSLPYLIDQARELASLTNTWIEATGDHRPTEQDGEDIAAFDRLCYTIREKTKATINRALRADQPSGVTQGNLVELAENFDRRSKSVTSIDPEYSLSKVDSKANSSISISGPVAALTRAARRLRIGDGRRTGSAGNSSQVSLQSIEVIPISALASNADTEGRSSPWAPSPSNSIAPSAVGWEASENEINEQYPTHAISWDRSGTRGGTRPIEDNEIPEVDANYQPRGNSISNRPDNINTELNAPGIEALKSSGSPSGAFTMSTSTFEDKSPISPRESGRKFTDVWSFRRKDKDKDRDRLDSITEQQPRLEDITNSNKKGTLTKKDREHDKREREKNIRDYSDKSKSPKDDKETEGKGKGRGKK